MVLSTLGVAADVTPSVIETFFSHYLNRKPLKEKPTAHISYHEGLRLIRQFLSYASQHSVEDVQAFTAQWVPTPTWVKTEDVTITDAHLSRAAGLIQAQLGPAGLLKIGGKEWWQWRRPEIPLTSQWIEMRQDYTERQAANDKGTRVILYVHGGAYYFGSVGEHRYQMQRHARKLKARLFAPEYRLAPQFPFPCGLHDCLAAYLQLIEEYHPSSILLGGDSAGGGMVVNMLVTMRDQGIPLPAGALLLSPWVDLTHSFPSVAGDGKFDYIPANGFHHKPSMAWPPPNSKDMDEMKSPGESAPRRSREEKKKLEREATQGFAVNDMPEGRNEVENPHNPATPYHKARRRGNTIPGGPHLSIELDGKLVELTDQIQMYTTNDMLAHPMVSPVMQPSLGGLPPLLIQTGGGELLRDEQVYLAHKAANPLAYPPSDRVLDEYDPNRTILNRYQPTHVQLQVWDDLCHVPHTLSFTRPAKFMYRSVAQFGAWALAHAQDQAITILDDDAISVISSDTDNDKANDDDESVPISDPASEQLPRGRTKRRNDTQGVAGIPIRAHEIATVSGSVGKAGDPLPPFQDYMIRQRVDRHGQTYPLAAASDIPGLKLDSGIIGVIKPGPVRKWLAKKSDWDVKYGKEKRSVQKQRMKEMAEGYDSFGPGEVPPPTALAGRRNKNMAGQKSRKGRSWGMAMWSGWGSKHDETTLEREQKINRRPTEAVVLPEAGAAIPKAGPERVDTFKAFERSKSPTYKTVTDLGQAGPLSRNAIVTDPAAPPPPPKDTYLNGRGKAPATAFALGGLAPATKVPGSENTFLSADNARPHNGSIAYPFKLKNEDAASSVLTLGSENNVEPMRAVDAASVLSAGSGRPGTGGAGAASLMSTDAVVDGVAGRKGSVVYEGGERVDGNGVSVVDGAGERPPLLTFVTAREQL